MAQFAVLVTYHEIMRRQPQLAELHALIAKYARRKFLFLLAKLNCLLGTWQNTPNFDADAQLCRVFLAEHWTEIDYLKKQSQRVVFSRITLLFLMKQVCRVCPDSGEVPGADAYATLGLASLMANDLLLPSVPSPSDTTLARLASLLPFSDYIAHDNYATEIARAQQMFDQISQLPTLKGRSDFLDIKALFQQSMGLSHLTFSQLVFGCSTKFLNVRIDDLKSPEAMVLRSSFFQKSTVPVTTADQFFRNLAIPESALADKVKSSKRPTDDFTIFQAYPLIEVADGVYTCLDPGFLAEKSGRGLYWTLFSELPNKQRSTLATFWGAIFEAYVNAILAQSYKAPGRFIPAPRFSNGDEAFDACLLEERNFIVFEHKSSTLRADCKFGGDVSLLKDDLHLKFVEGDDEGPKGVAQLSNNLVRFLSGIDVQGINRTQVSKIYPVLVCLDSSAGVPYMARYFNEQFRDRFPRKSFKSKTVTPVFTLTIADLENLLGYLAVFTLSDIFESFYNSDRSMLTSLSASEIPLLRSAPAGKNPLREGFTAFGKQMEKDLFGVSTGSDNS